MSETTTAPDQTTTTPTEPSTPTETQTTEPTTSWLDSVELENPDSRKSLEKFKDPSDLAKSYLEAEKGLSQRLKVPEKDDQESWDKVFDQLGRPKEPGEYSFDDIENKELLQDSVTQSTLERFKEAAHKYGLNQRMAAGIVNEILGHSAEQASQMQEAQQQAVAELKQEFGNAFDERVGLANNTARKMVEKAGGDWDRFSEKLAATGMANDPDLVRAFGAMGRMMEQDKLWGSGGEPNSIGGRTPAEIKGEIDRLQSENMDDILNQTPVGQQTQDKIDKLLDQLGNVI